MTRFFDPVYGLKAIEVANAVSSFGPMRFGVDDRFWAFTDGVWSPAEPLLHRRIVHLLGDRYRPHHGQTVRDVLRAELDELQISPVSSYINVYNGMVEWGARDGPTLIPHDPLYLSTVQLPVTYHPDAQCPNFDAFLTQVVAPDDIERVWEALGYFMMSGNPLQRTFLFTGGGGNGKGVLLEVMKRLLGAQNCSAVPLQEFATSQWATAELLGRLANVCGDIDAAFIESTARIKEITGEDTLKGERKFGHPFYFKPWCKMVFSANEIPASADSSRGWSRRWEVIHFPNEPSTPDIMLTERVSTPAELRGVAAHAIDSLRDLMARRTFARGASSDAAKVQFEQRNNKLLVWIEEDCDHPNPTRWYDRRDLYKAFKRWDEVYGGGGRGMGSTTFYGRLKQIRGMREAKHRGQWGFWGLLLLKDIAFGEVLDGSPLEPTPPDDLQKRDGAKVPPQQTALDLHE